MRTPADADVASPRSGFREPRTGGAPSAQAEPGHDRAPMRALADAELRLEQRVMRRVDAALGKGAPSEYMYSTPGTRYHTYEYGRTSMYPLYWYCVGYR